MLCALYNKKTIYVHQNSSAFLKDLSEKKELICPDCGEILIYKESEVKQSHFSHFNSDCSFPFREPESIEHESGKLSIYDWLVNQFDENECDIERHIPVTKQRADTFVISENLAVEFQCSVIQSKTWTHRHKLYEEAEITDIWILGYSMHKQDSHSNYYHKLNSLEESLLNQYGKIIYFDVLTKQFIFLYIEKKTKKHWIGSEYFFKPDEVFIKNGQIFSKYEYFILNQKKRKNYLSHEISKAKKTDSFIKGLKEEVVAEKTLATKKQVNYIKYLLHQQNMKIPYKFHGLLKDEADLLIKKLKNEA